ncbi:uroporphyrinogen-III synthase [Aliiroseovarius subalbicans]|uniref:uroporphyrinogen-III synthase n=1 Tax=Aliiroseovarius subalbicans TaxID=2925840 RepID=UPI001F59AC33|nr:uroporphyrinogen-III synthase [Aliiroseovarius subalbicans]MCI2400011.1 uroporphyrinogen-III synthase [Aliiroseovarius subalbicans]
MPQFPTLVLTRPKAQALRVVAAVEARLKQSVHVVLSPVMQIKPRAERVAIAGYGGIILSSANGAASLNDASGVTAHCVGPRTASAARAKGADIGVVAQDADELVQRLMAAPPVGRLLHLRGETARGDIAERLNSGGIETDETVTYTQDPVPLTTEAKALIEGDEPVVLPLYSPLSAVWVGQGVTMIGPRVRVIALSQAVAEGFTVQTGVTPEVCAVPNGAEMVSRIVAALTSDFA